MTWSVRGATSTGTTISAEACSRRRGDRVVAHRRGDVGGRSDKVTLGPGHPDASGSGTGRGEGEGHAGSVVRGGTFTLTVDVRAQSPHRKAPKVIGEVAVTFGGTTQVVPLRGGAAVVELPTDGLPAGVHPVHVAYSGDRVHAPTAAVHQQLRVR
ncbi:Ig-like domain-containing protein [Micromonospora noduli]|uniref:Ig-like domain-containing protein n=1 Tax=Micromonospora noduli TaxID=709876 RepID=UPI001FC93107|nr:Ig-like domain-containing protein [Micromonospora noduli]